ncbi:hypothetical protein [Streptomyces sp. CdTB01]|uniref:hypothetical protein n=1 Tax=Streptomyces sp. CdTB01 TaxID=1725411 RepID=UPI00131F39C1|nr:hypothetical protein [Streptomyces sp. CdTB01]
MGGVRGLAVLVLVVIVIGGGLRSIREERCGDARLEVPGGALAVQSVREQQAEQ